MKNANTKDLARRLFNKHHDLMGHFDFYPGVVSLYGMARLAAESGSASLLKEITDAIMPYVRDERRFPLNFKNYYCGGVGTAYLLAKGLLPEAEGIVRHYAEEIMLDAPRDSEGILCHPQYPGEERIWIDVAFSVGPFLLFAGIALNDDRYCKEAFNQVAKMIKV
jgi:unsaturated rhamnogalacturonyl hydrolase